METLSKKENVIPPSEVERIIDILPYTPSVKNSHTQPSVKNSHTPPSACGLVWSMGILHLGLSMGILHLGCIRKNIYTPPSFGGRNVPFCLPPCLFCLWYLKWSVCFNILATNITQVLSCRMYPLVSSVVCQFSTFPLN